MGGERVDATAIGERGVHGDRLWAVRDEEKGALTNAKRIPSLLMLDARYVREPAPDVGPGTVPDVVITFPDGTTVSSSDAHVDARLSEFLGKRVTLCSLRPASDKAHYKASSSSAAEMREQFALDEGAPLPDFTDAAVLLPAGARGPAFLVGPNFRAILRYNNSTNYALAVGLLAQGVAGGPGVQAPWPRELPALSRSQLLALQTALNERGFPSGEPDGVMGPATRQGIRRYQRSLGLPADGYPSVDLLERLLQP